MDSRARSGSRSRVVFGRWSSARAAYADARAWSGASTPRARGAETRRRASERPARVPTSGPTRRPGPRVPRAGRGRRRREGGRGGGDARGRGRRRRGRANGRRRRDGARGGSAAGAALDLFALARLNASSFARPFAAAAALPAIAPGSARATPRAIRSLARRRLRTRSARHRARSCGNGKFGDDARRCCPRADDERSSGVAATPASTHGRAGRRMADLNLDRRLSAAVATANDAVAAQPDRFEMILERVIERLPHKVRARESSHRAEAPAPRDLTTPPSLSPYLAGRSRVHRVGGDQARARSWSRGRRRDRPRDGGHVRGDVPSRGGDGP